MTDEQDMTFTVAEVAEQFRVDRTTVQRWIESDKLKAEKVPWGYLRYRYRIRQSAIDAFKASYGQEE